jgi:hypothetical protein
MLKREQRIHDVYTLQLIYTDERHPTIRVTKLSNASNIDSNQYTKDGRTTPRSVDELRNQKFHHVLY